MRYQFGGGVTSSSGGSADQPLPVEVRQQLLTIAADVMGRTPASELPAAVRRFSRFAPSKRLRLGAAEIAAALAADDAFRDSVANVVREASPELAEQVMSGAPPATADPIDVAVITYLLRPDGWQDRLTEISAGLAEQSERRQAGGEATRMAAEMDRLRQAHGDLVRARDAARTAAKGSSAEHAKQVADLQRQLRGLQAELRTVQRAAETAKAEAMKAKVEQQRSESAAAADLRRARNRVTELERELDSARRAARGEREHDDARVWLLLEQVSSAANGLRRELGVSRPGVAPADTVAALAGRSGARPSSLDGTLLDRLLDGSHVHLVVDGYNLTKSGYPEMTLAEQRSRLVSSLGALASRTGVEVTVAFDGTAAPTGAAASLPTPRGVRVLFSVAGQLADDLIRTLLLAEPEGRTVVVASSDEAVAASARGRGAWSVPATVMLSRLERS
ncbi:MAG: hypothetical protein QOK10_3308 [Pseudonocardiales bacterium]|nr:hypothetical protein [Pseudonocardiales bacterium]